MKRKFTLKRYFPEGKRPLLLTLFALFISHCLWAHNVDSYATACSLTNSAYMYKIDANVSSVNSASRYKWQYKKTSNNTWVCLVNGSNTINGQSYTVSGSYSTGTNPAPLVFENPNSSLQGVIIRCIISDGADPCTFPSGNTYNSGSNSLNFSINVNGSPCANNLLDVGNRVWYDANNNGKNDSEASGEYGIANLTVKLYADANNDNVADGAAIATTTTDDDGYFMFNDKAAGNYIIGVTPPAGYMSSTVNGGDPDNDINLDDNGQVVVGNEVRGLAITLATGTEYDGSSRTTNTNISYDFGFLPDCSCTTSGNNLLVNGSFENGTTGWNASGGTVSSGTGYVACGSANGFNNWSTGTSTVYQDVNVSEGAILTLKGFAGTHTAGIGCSPKLGLVFYNGSTRLSTNQATVTVTQDVDKNHSQLAQYTVTATAPANATKVRVEATITCNTLKMDAFCLTSSNILQLGNRVWYDNDNDGILDNGENGIANLSVKLYQDANNDDVADGAAIATDVTDNNGYYSFGGLPAGNYIVGVTPPAGYVSSLINGGDPDNSIDNDDNGSIVVGNEVRGRTITLVFGSEPSGNTNNTYDFGFLPDCDCTNSSNNLLTNGSFENGTTGWSASGGTVTAGPGYVACGSANGFNNWSTGTSTVYQQVNASPGLVYTLKGFAGTHTAGIGCAPTLSLVFYNGNTRLSTNQATVTVTQDVDKNHSQLAQYTVTATAPSNATKVQVEATITCNTLKMDAFCLTSNCVTPTTPVVGTTTQPTCTVATGSVALSGLPSGNWTISRTSGNGVVNTPGTGSSTTITGLIPGRYTFTVKNSIGCVSDPTNTVVINARPATPVAPTLNEVNPTCTVATGGFTIASPVGSSYTYSVDNGTYTSSTSFSNLAAGSAHTVKVKSSEGCISPATSITIDPQPVTPPVFNYLITEGACNGGTATLVATNLPDGAWKINYPGGIFTGEGDTFLVSNVYPGSYTASVTNDDGCTSAQVTINVGNADATAALGGLAWNDINKDGIRVSTEAVLANVPVDLYEDLEADGLISGSPIATTITANNGTYLFPGLCYGNYIVKFGLPNSTTSYVRTVRNNKVGNDNGDSDADPTTGTTGTIHLDAGAIDKTNDAGYYTSSILPVNFGAITAQARNCEVYIDFEVLTQKNTKKFVIEYSKNAGINWQDIAVIDAKETGATSYKYSFRHTQPVAGKNLYRIRGVDADGKVTYSEIITTLSSCSGKGTVVTYPNPTYNVLNVVLPSNLQDAQLQIVNSLGQVVVADAKKIGLVRSLNMENLAPGMYLMKVIQDGKVITTQKVVKSE